MTSQDKFIALTRKGEDTRIEYKTCTEEISESLYESSESQGQVLDSLKDSSIQKECDAKIDQTLAEIQQILGIEIK